MVDGPLIITIIFSLVLSMLGLAALLRNTREPINQNYFAFSVAVSLWLVINYIAADPGVSHDVALVSNRLVLIAGGLAIVTLLGFVLQLSRLAFFLRWYKPLLVINIVSWLLCLTPQVVSDVSIKDNLVVNAFGPLAPAYFAPLFATFVVVVAVLISGHRKLSGVRKKQLDTISKSILSAIPIIIVCNAVLPIFGYYGLVSVAPLALSIIVFTMFYVIAKHKLFNMRLVIVRSLAYVLTLGLISIVYSLFIHYLTVRIERQYDSQLLSDIINVSFVVIVVLTYQPLKNQFDKLAVRFFYKDSYDPQEFLDNLNRIIVSNIKVDSLIKETVAVIDANLKSEFTLFSLKETDYATGRLIGDAQPQSMKADLESIKSRLQVLNEQVTAADNIVDSDPSLHRAMRTHNIAVIAKLTPTTQSNEGELGYIVIGDKKSGNPYSKQDINIIQIIANELVIAIENALRFEEIENFNQTLQEKVDDATKRLKRANEKLKAMDETKDEFISMASHQLRTPLTSVKGYVSMVLEGDAGKLNDMQRKLLEQSFISSQRMVYLIADLLNLSRLKTGKFVIEPRPTNLAEVIQSEVEQLVETAAGKDLKLVYNRPKTFPTLMLDETKIRQVIMNFVDNAIYYTPAGGKIEISLVENDHSVEFTVKDNGIGVPDSEQHHLFNKFFRAKNAQKARPDGTGLGLFMAKKVIVAQGGAIIFSSKVGKGSTFGFTFNKEKLAVAPATPKTTVQKALP